MKKNVTMVLIQGHFSLCQYHPGELEERKFWYFSLDCNLSVSGSPYSSVSYNYTDAFYLYVIYTQM